MILKRLLLLGVFLTFTAPAFAQHIMNAAGSRKRMEPTNQQRN